MYRRHVPAVQSSEANASLTCIVHEQVCFASAFSRNAGLLSNLRFV
jgi:hypothetical protein